MMIAWLVLGSDAAGAQVRQGLSMLYPGDVGIASDPRVVLFEDFETSSVSNLAGRWDQVLTGPGMTLQADVPIGSQGTRSIQITAQGGGGEGGHLYTRLSRGLDTIYVRHYVKYRSGPGFDGHTGVWLGGYDPPTPYPQGGAGIRPLGNDRFFLTFQPFDRTRMDFYAYWMGMSGLPNGFYWGNSFIQDPAVQTRLDQWVCIEVMLKGNNPVGSKNGELAVWVDGVPVAHLGPGYPNGYDNYGVFTPNPAGPPWPGFQWRSTADLEANFVWISLYEPALAAGAIAQARFDQVVVATEYIGPINRSVPEPTLAFGLAAGMATLGGIGRSRGRSSDASLPATAIPKLGS